MLLDGNDNDSDLGNNAVKKERKGRQKLKTKTEIGSIRTSQYHL